MEHLTDYIENTELLAGMNRVYHAISENAQLKKIADKLLNILTVSKSSEEFFDYYSSVAPLVNSALKADSECFLAVVFDMGFDSVLNFYKNKKIPLSVLSDTMYDFNTRASNYYITNNHGGIDHYPWLFKHMTGVLFQIGRLQYDIYRLEFDIKESNGYMNCGDFTAAIHIPAHGRLEPDKCISSLKEAKKTFSAYFPELNIKGFTCNSWLLGPELREALSEGSNILSFSNLFTHFGSPKESTNNRIYNWIFGFDKDISKYKEHKALNAMQKTAHTLLDAGHWFSDEWGFILTKDIV